MKISKDSYWLKSGFFTVLERLSLVLFGFGGFYFLLKILTKEEFGIWSLFLIVTSLIEMARNGLIQNAVVKFLASSDEKESPKIITASLTLNCLLTVVSIISLLVLPFFLVKLWKAPQLELMFHLYIITTIALIPFSQLNFVQQARMDFQAVFWSNFSRQGIILIVILIAYFLKLPLKLHHIVITHTFAAIGSSLLSYFLIRKHLKFSKEIDWTWVKKLFHFGKYVFGTNISSVIYSSIDQMILGSLLSTSSVAVYNLAIRITNLVEVPVNSVSAIVFPQSAKRVETDGKAAVKDLYEKSVAVILAIVLPCVAVVMIFSELIIRIISGGKYMEAANILRVTILYTLLLPYARQFGTLLDSIGKPKTNFLLIMLTAAINGTVNYFFIKTWGIMGAAMGTLLTSCIFFVLNQIILHRILEVDTMNTFRYLKGFYVTWFGQIKGLLIKN